MNCQSAIDGVVIHPLRVIEDSRGAVLHWVRTDSAFFDGFGEAYFSEVFPGAVKAWKRNLRVTQRLAVPVGQVSLGLYDSRSGSPSYGAVELHELGRSHGYALIVIPPLVWYGWRCSSDTPALVANCIASVYDPADSEQSTHPTGMPSFEWSPDPRN